MQELFCLFDTNFCCYLLLANTSSSGIKVSGNRAQRNYGYADPKTVGWRWIEVDLSKQRLIAWTAAENRVMLSSFQPESYHHLPQGFAIQSRHRFARMQGSDYNIPDVPTQCPTIFTEPTGITALVLQLAMVASM